MCIRDRPKKTQGSQGNRTFERDKTSTEDVYKRQLPKEEQLKALWAVINYGLEGVIPEEH